MLLRRLCFVFFPITFVAFPVFSQNQEIACQVAFGFVTEELAVENTIQICTNSNLVPFQYKAEIDMPVCTDTLCANVALKIYWDLAGNYMGFDTIPGQPLTKFDHKLFQENDYLKLHQILRNRNSVLRNLKKEDLIDKSVQVKATTVDAVTGATPQTIKKSVVNGAVYSSFTLWHFVNGALKNRLAFFTQTIYSEQIALQLLNSDNYETQLFALRKLSESDFEIHSELLFGLIRQSAPIIKAYIIAKEPLPFNNIEKNKQFINLFPELDDYSKSIFLNRITDEESVAKSLLPLVYLIHENFDQKQQELIAGAYLKFEIPEVQKLNEKLQNN